MIGFLLSPANTPFTVALAVMLAFTVIEILSTSLGMGISDLIDSILPEFDADIDIDANLNLADGGSPADSLTKLLAWFRIGEVPMVMLFIIFLTGFGLSGLILQFTMISITGRTVPLLITVPTAILTAFSTVRFFGGFLGKYMPKDETYAVSEESFVGMMVTITLGCAQAGKSAQAKLRDKYGQTHYILVEPDNFDDFFKQGEKGIIVNQQGATFKIIKTDNTAMTD